MYSTVALGFVWELKLVILKSLLFLGEGQDILVDREAASRKGKMCTAQQDIGWTHVQSKESDPVAWLSHANGS
jgi:hypothetical protein